jgi:hypothetical protein
MSALFTAKEDARLVIRHRALEVKTLAVRSEKMGEHDEAARLAETYQWLEAASETLRDEPEKPA